MTKPSRQIIFGVLTAALLLVLVAGAIVAYVAPRNASERTALVQVAASVFGSLLLVGTIYAAIRTVQINTRQLGIAREGQITDRFAKAIELLGHDRPEARIGGIYALERIARDSCRGDAQAADWCRDHLAVTEVLTAYVRAKSPAPELPSDPKETDKPPADIQAALTVLGRRTDDQRATETRRLDLSNTNLRGAYLLEAHLENAEFEKAHLEDAILEDAHLEGAHFRYAHLQKAVLWHAQLSGTSFWWAHLEGAILRGVVSKGLEPWPHLKHAVKWGGKTAQTSFVDAYLQEAHLEDAILPGASFHSANLQGAHLERAHLEGALFWGANLQGAHLQGAYLRDADLTGTRLGDANLRGADLENTRLERVDLSETKGLTQDQIDKSCMDKKTELPLEYRPSNRVCEEERS